MPDSIYELTDIDPDNLVVKIARADGVGTITFRDIRVPSVLPDFTYQGRRQKVSVMRPSALSPGYRVFQSYGSHDNYMDFSIEFPLVLRAEVLRMVDWFNARPGAVLLSLDNGTTRYLCMWKDNGLQITNYPFNQRIFSKVKVELMVISKTTSVTFNS